MLRVWQAAAMSSPSGPPPGAPGPAEERARTRRVALLVGSVIVVLTLLATIVPHLLRPPVPAGAGVPGGPSVEAVPLPEESFYPPEEYPELVLPPVPDGCPKPLVELGVHVQADWFPVVVANGQDYQMQETYRPLTPGPAVVTIRCDIIDISGGGQAVVPKPWPDGTSSGLPVDTVVTEVAGASPACFLMARQDITWLLRAVDERGRTPAACVGVPDP